MPYPLTESRIFMKNNYHTHTVRCRHAQDTEREYIEAAIAAGIKTLGFADHAPQIFPGDYYSHFRMRPEELEDYCRTIRTLKEEYKDRIDIKIGLEAEYYPDLFEDLISSGTSSDGSFGLAKDFNFKSPKELLENLCN